MSIEDQSVNFVENHMKTSFNEIMSSRMIKDMYWIETDIGARCVARMFEPNNREEKLIVLFPPFVPTE